MPSASFPRPVKRKRGSEEFPMTSCFETVHPPPQEATAGKPCGSTCDVYVSRIEDGLFDHPEYARSHHHGLLQLLLY